ncbi:MAG: transporter related protein [Frankiales bacterium]|nr:transporter related protein [Frankiales bacterium]
MTTTDRPEIDAATRGDLALEVLGMSRRFGDVLANDRVDFSVRSGEVHALVGENGAGKSTLLKLIFGLHKPDAGEMLLHGRQVVIESPSDARRLGLGMVFQDLRLVPAFTVAENVALAMQQGGLGLHLRALQKAITAASDRFGLAVDPSAYIRHLSIGERQRVEILKLLMTGARVVILDEPTSVLAPQEVDALFDVVRDLRDRGYAVVIVTHKLGEVRAIADRVTVLRGGRVVLGDADPRDHDDSALIEAMVGRQVADLPAQRAAVPHGEIAALTMVHVSADSDRGHRALHDVELTVWPGEIVGIAGVAGSGQRELCEVAMGVRRATAGTVTVSGADVTTAGPSDVRAAGAAEVPEDPIEDAVIPGLSVLEHVVVGELDSLRRRVGINWRAAAARVESMESDVGLRMPAADRSVASLSGGNIQRVVLTRAFAAGSALLVAAYPSRGLDIATTRRTQQLLLDKREAGVGVLLISEDLDELLALSDRVVVMHAGHIAGEVVAHGADRAEIGRLMVGGAA